MECPSSCWDLWCPVNADSWGTQICVMLGVLGSLSQVLARGIVPNCLCFSWKQFLPSMTSQGDSFPLQCLFYLHTSHSVLPNMCKSGCEFRVGKKEIREIETLLYLVSFFLIEYRFFSNFSLRKTTFEGHLGETP